MSITFLHEWKNEDGSLRAIPHMSTKNTSFLRTCFLLKKMGIKNYAFPLCLYDPDLLDVDVYDLEENTPENEHLRTKVMIEARRNVWYYLREVARVYEQGGSPIRFRLDRASVAMTFCFINGIDYAVMQCRQTGKTVGALTLYAWVLYTSGEQFEMGMMAKDGNLATQNVKRVRTFGENLPSWWLSEDKNNDKKNTEELYYAALKTHYQSFVAQKDKSQADLKARGASPPSFHFDEFDYTANIGISYPTILASTSKARENAKKNGKPHSNIITTTAGDPMKPECREAAKIMEGAMSFTEFLYDIENKEKLHEVVEASSPQKMLLGVWSHLQLGYDNKWLRDTITRNRMTRDQVLRDYLNRRVSITEQPVIPKEILAIMNSSMMEPKWVDILYGKFAVYWYLPEDIVTSEKFKNVSIVVGCDSSEMINRDATTLVGIDPRDMSVVFTFRCNEGNINTVGVAIAMLLIKYPKMVWVPENKSSGTSLIDIVSLSLRKEGINPFARIFNWVVNNMHEAEFAKYDIRDRNLLDTSVRKYFGIKTDKSKRDELYSTTLISAAKRAPTRIRDRVLISELNSLTVRNGRVDHEVGGHDDTAVAWLLANWFVMNGKHLDVYGIKPGTALSYLSPTQHDKNELDVQRQQMVKDKIEELEKKVRTLSDPSLKRLIEADITVLRSMVKNHESDTPETADDFLRNPRRFADQEVVEQNRRPVNREEVTNTMMAALGLG